MVNRFIDIGFGLTKMDLTGSGWVREYEYHPPYLMNNYYNLVLFTAGKYKEISDKTDYRLYIHDENHEYVNCEFQLSYKGNEIYLNQKFNEIFKMELRDGSIDQILE